MKKQTAVEWLAETITKNHDKEFTTFYGAEIEEALAMEKKKSLYSFFAGFNYEGAFPVDEHEDYYKETYGK
jgi:hypothetical protein